MAVKRKKNSGRGQGAGFATIDLEENEKEMESLISELRAAVDFSIKCNVENVPESNTYVAYM